MKTAAGAGFPSARWVRCLTIGFWLVAIVLGALQAWRSRFEMSPDGIQYLDNADAYWSGDFPHAINSLWSPLYPWLIGALNSLVRPSPNQEFPRLHLLNFVIYICVLACFQFYLGSLRALLAAGEDPPRRNLVTLFCLFLISYTCCLYCVLDFTSLGYVTPDLLMSLFAFLSAGLLVRIPMGRATTLHHVAFGVVLGMGYLAKAPFFLYALLCLGLSCVFAGKRWPALARVGATAIAFAVIAGPYVWMLSNAKGRFTFGDSGRFNLIWMVNGVPYYNWQGGPPESGAPIHPTRQLLMDPDVFEFATPVAGTYPPWYDPTYWSEGAKVAFRPGDFARALVRQLRLYGYLIHHRQVPLAFALLAIFVLLPDKRRIPGSLRHLWPVILFAVTPFTMYAIVHAEPRYLAPFFVLLWTSLFAGLLRGSESLDARVLVSILAIAGLLMLVEAVTVTFAAPPIDTAQNPAHAASGRLHYEIARQLGALGLERGDQVAIVTGDFPYYWARLAGVRITMEVSFGDGPYKQRETQWAKAREVLSSRGARFIVSSGLPGVVDQPDWQELGHTGIFACRLRSSP